MAGVPCLLGTASAGTRSVWAAMVRAGTATTGDGSEVPFRNKVIPTAIRTATAVIPATMMAVRLRGVTALRPVVWEELLGRVAASGQGVPLVAGSLTIRVAGKALASATCDTSAEEASDCKTVATSSIVGRSVAFLASICITKSTTAAETSGADSTKGMGGSRRC